MENSERKTRDPVHPVIGRRGDERYAASDLAEFPNHQFLGRKIVKLGRQVRGPIRRRYPRTGTGGISHLEASMVDGGFQENGAAVRAAAGQQHRVQRVGDGKSGMEIPYLI
ncbi:hypothetical protein [Marimonas arenosa]|uniref:Uncharacterized protein n=1 Tax=Marimonas arenosa TaxID=1795305 RepID=A0AAE3WDX6_9RHOB|nr:hypothetical protein [Marimonas arenosa]MDQ2091226.1 hypothetical protein [Marimonas arenosa]